MFRGDRIASEQFGEKVEKGVNDGQSESSIEEDVESVERAWIMWCMPRNEICNDGCIFPSIFRFTAQNGAGVGGIAYLR